MAPTMVRPDLESQTVSRNDTDYDPAVANAVGPWVASYNTYTSGEVTARADTPIWILVIAGLLLGLGFWSRSTPVAGALLY